MVSTGRVVGIDCGLGVYRMFRVFHVVFSVDSAVVRELSVLGVGTSGAVSDNLPSPDMQEPESSVCQYCLHKLKSALTIAQERVQWSELLFL
ncbi:hypothetical protein COEREDRAFT_12575 [Coemansia reversa NRRL 1564]|uniref:Uncharacterized protein n=1 Tax=Coemansia reversa (strain ATCC 12441 / NRRL 1564) TaxID=763665 RepID=A0A2G5B0M8_COERN|nr:hypothetical protein COEREDRAFT_12575 [Coemansia reversa NRRL 1564]|eukprot:PIA12575.1 hypothetical protein COEREDRAFT_12575 [Coemansia reversa NRRL 1564]